jgi:hypothetical protein
MKLIDLLWLMCIIMFILAATVVTGIVAYNEVISYFFDYDYFHSLHVNRPPLPGMGRPWGFDKVGYNETLE